MEIKIKNPNLSEVERTTLTADVAAAGTALTVRNAEGYTTSWYAIVGEPGQEQTEGVLITGTTGNTQIDVGALNFAHPKSTPVYLSKWNQWNFWRQATGGAFASFSTTDIEWDDASKTSTIVVAGGVTTDTYKWRPYNSTLPQYGTFSDTLAGTGLTRRQVGYLIKQVQKNAVANNVKDETIIDYFNDYQDLVYEQLPKAWWFSKEGDEVSTIVSTYKYPISSNWSDWLSEKLLLYRFILGDTTDITYPLTWATEAEMRNMKADANQTDDDNAKYWTLYPPDDDSALGYIVLHPTPKTVDCFLIPVHYRELTRLDSFGDIVVIPTTKGYIDYAFYRIYDDIKEDKTNADKYNIRVRGSIQSLRSRSRRQRGQPELTRYRGVRGWSRLFGTINPSSSNYRETHW